MASARVSMGELTEEYLKEARRIEGERRAKKRLRTVEAQPFWPHEAMRDTALILFFVAGTLYISAAMPYFLEAPANPAGQPEVILPDWYLLWSYGLLKPGVANPIGEATPWEVPGLSEVHGFVNPGTTVVLDAKTIGLILNGILVVPLVLLPFIDRGNPRRPQEAPLQAGLGVALIVFLFMVSVFSVNNVVYNEYPVWGAPLYDLTPRPAHGAYLPDDPALSGMREITVSATVSVEELGNTKWILSKADALEAGAASYYIRVLSSNAIEFGLGLDETRNGRVVSTLHTIAAGNLRDSGVHTFAFTYNGTTFTGWFDGEPLERLEVAGSVTRTGAPLLLGNGPAAAGQVKAYFAGTIDDVRVVDRALATSEMENLTSLGVLSGDVVRWGFDGNDLRPPTMGVPGAAFSEPSRVVRDGDGALHFAGVRSTLAGIPAILFWTLPLPLVFAVLRWRVLGYTALRAAAIGAVLFLLLIGLLMYNIGDWTPFLPFYLFHGCQQPIWTFPLCIGAAPLVTANPAFDPINGLLLAMQRLDNTLLAWMTWWLTIASFEITFFALAYWKLWSERRETYEFFLNRTYYRVR
ncbi:MAG TPA: LamG-like jellyroll fold domain-containing protein [Candidatus Thermoplasmatota archaeon]|nr:LamG-like jellyroll fold domain-containing protein [Candidatus Thermoplasmatota archaeon]